jgi:glycosyltransferase involved in cell wall biosynthesis
MKKLPGDELGCEKSHRKIDLALPVVVHGLQGRGCMGLVVLLGLWWGSFVAAETTPGLCHQIFQARRTALSRHDLLRVESATVDFFRRQAKEERKILVFTDATYSQSSGVVTVMKVLKDRVKALTDMDVVFVTPDDLRWKLDVGFQDLSVSFALRSEIENFIRKHNPVAVHVMVEGPLGWRVRNHLKEHRIPFTTAYHTDFPKYAAGYVAKAGLGFAAPLVERWGYRILRQFHKPSDGIMVPTPRMAQVLLDHGFSPGDLRYWSHGVYLDRFNPSWRDRGAVYSGMERPISLYVGRIAPEKNLETFLRLPVPGTKVVIGKGPDAERLKKMFPEVRFLGVKDNATELPMYFAQADVFVFPSLTDTLGLVNYESLASGTPVVAFEVQGPADTIRDPRVGVLVEHRPRDFHGDVERLADGWHRALALSREDAREYAEQNTWDQSVIEFLYFLSPLPVAMGD